LTDFAIPDDYGPKVTDSVKVALPAGGSAGMAASANSTKSGGSNATFLLGLILGGIGTPFAITYYRRRFDGMTQEEVIQHLLTSSKSIFDKILGLLMTLISKVTKK
jgi:hypothetical protein